MAACLNSDGRRFETGPPHLDTGDGLPTCPVRSIRAQVSVYSFPLELPSPPAPRKISDPNRKILNLDQPFLKFDLIRVSK